MCILYVSSTLVNGIPKFLLFADCRREFRDRRSRRPHGFYSYYASPTHAPKCRFKIHETTVQRKGKKTWMMYLPSKRGKLFRPPRMRRFQPPQLPQMGTYGFMTYSPYGRLSVLPAILLYHRFTSAHSTGCRPEEFEVFEFARVLGCNIQSQLRASRPREDCPNLAEMR